MPQTQETFKSHYNSITDKFNNFSQKHSFLSTGFDFMSGAAMYTAALAIGTAMEDPTLIGASKVIFAATLFTGGLLPGFITKQCVATTYASTKSIQNGLNNWSHQ